MPRLHPYWIGALAIFAAVCSCGCEAEALAISANIQARHMPFGTILDPIFASPTSNHIIGYTRCGDSAIWTGHYLAAESYRFKVTAISPRWQTRKKLSPAFNL